MQEDNETAESAQVASDQTPEAPAAPKQEAKSAAKSPPRKRPTKKAQAAEKPQGGNGKDPEAAAHVLLDPEQLRENFQSDSYPYKNKMKRDVYERHKQELQVELLKVQRWVKESGQKIVLIFEGRDAAGKGGTIKRYMEHLNPRGARVVALEKPGEQERGGWYFQRYISHLPTRGEIVLFDRSWYNRAGVERVMNFCNSVEYLEFMRQAPELEVLH